MLSLVACSHAKKELPNLEEVTGTFRRDRQVQIYSRVTRVQIICCIHSPIQAKDKPLNGTFLDILPKEDRFAACGVRTSRNLRYHHCGNKPELKSARPRGAFLSPSAHRLKGI